MTFSGILGPIPTSIRGKVEEINGYSEDELVSGNPSWQEIIHPDDLSRLKLEVEKARFTKISAGCPRLQSEEECVPTPAFPWHRKVHLHR